MDKNSIILLEKLLSNNANFQKYKSETEHTFYNALFRAPKNDIILSQNSPSDALYILLEGSVSIVDECADEYNSIIDSVEPIHILGLVEILNHIDTYCAFVIANTPCTFLKFTTSEFLNAISQNVALCYRTLITLSHSTQANMYRAKSQYLLQQEDILGHYFFQLVRTKGKPYIYPHTREYLADKLHINLRTLYRYLDMLKKQELITIQQGKIIITEKNFQKLNFQYSNLSFK